MVGIAGRSKACSTCRHRRISCDQARPVCGQCVRRNRICGGYERPTLFLNQFSDTFSEKPSQTSSVRSDPTIAEAEAKSQNIDETIVTARYNRNQSVISLVSCSRFERHQLLANFVDATLPRQRSRQVPLSWIIDIANTPSEANALSHAGAAIGHGWIGHFDMLPPAVKRGHRSYMESLVALRVALTNANDISPRVQLVTMTMLLLYEMIEFGTIGDSGWIVHAEGIEGTLSRTTPQNFVATTNHKIFLFCRAVIILKSLTLRKRTILATNEWLHGPWMLHSKTVFHRLLDLAAEATTLMEDFDRMASQRVCSSFEIRKWAASVALHVLKLKQWEKEHGCELPEYPPEPIKGPFPPPATSQSVARGLTRHWYPSRYPDRTGAQFLLLQQVRLMLFHWALVVSVQACILEMTTLTTLTSSAGDRNSSKNGIQEFEEDIRAAITTSDATKCADLINLWFKFAVQDAWQSFGPVFGVFSLKAAAAWYQVYQRRRLPDLEPDRAFELQACYSLLDDFVKYGSPRTKDFGGQEKAPKQ